MVVKDICTREVITATKDSTVIHAAKLMEEYNTGSVVIIKKNEIKHIPIGLITDRDVAIKFVATEMNQQEDKKEETIKPKNVHRIGRSETLRPVGVSGMKIHFSIC